MINGFFAKITTPSKFNIGCSNLWRGLPLSILNKIIYKVLSETINNRVNKKLPPRSNEYLFRSARAGINTILKSQNIGEGHEVIVSGFTCSAVTSAVNGTNAKILYVDINKNLSMNYKSIIDNINNNTKALIIQNTFGQEGLDEHLYKKLSKKGLLLIEDNCLSIGTKKNNLELNKNGHFIVESLESSKSFTIGRGGIVRCNSKKFKSKFETFYKSLKRENIISDFLKIFQLWVNVFFTNYPIKNGFLIWYFLYGFGIFKKSKSENKILNSNKLKLGKLSEVIYYSLLTYRTQIFLKANNIFNLFLDELKRNNIKTVIDYKKKNFIVTPRIPILVPKENLGRILLHAKENKIEISRWFYESPPKLNLEINTNKSSYLTKFISERIINIPSYCTNDKDIYRVKKFIRDINYLL